MRGDGEGHLHPGRRENSGWISATDPARAPRCPHCCPQCCPLPPHARLCLPRLQTEGASTTAVQIPSKSTIQAAKPTPRRDWKTRDEKPTVNLGRDEKLHMHKCTSTFTQLLSLLYFKYSSLHLPSSAKTFSFGQERLWNSKVRPAICKLIPSSNHRSPRPHQTPECVLDLTLISTESKCIQT